ncbi:ABC transporter permease [Olsenella urininfantis]|uniref:ABC transporter permease n=1 Tax=Olsenella urininfantis TaxID=1871033 RepID=UPI0009855FF0|nr:ABC transporter permease [Olsenella urininfantis]
MSSEKACARLLRHLRSLSVQSKHEMLRMAVAIAIGLAVAVILVVLTTEDAGQALAYFVAAPFMGTAYFSHMVEVIIPLVMTGSAVCVMFSANQFNLGLEGTIYLGGLAAALAGVYLVPDLPVLSPVVCILLGGLVGFFVMAIPALLQYKFKANIVVSTLMMNYVCLYVGLFFLFRVFKDPASSQHTLPIGPCAHLPVLFAGTRIHAGLLLAAAVVAASYLLLYKTRMGAGLRMVGQNPKFAQCMGLGVSGLALASQFIGGAIGGMTGAVQMLGLYDRFQWTSLMGWGWDGVTMAIFARNNPKYLPLAAIFLAYFRTGAWVMSFKAGVQIDLVSVFEGVMVLFLMAEKFLSGTYRKMVFADADRKRQERMSKGEEAVA